MVMNEATSEKKRKHPIRNRIIFYSVFLIIVFGYMPRRLLYPGNREALPSPPAVLFSGASVVDYKTKDGVVLRGAWVRSSRPDPLTVLYFHGNAESAATGIPLAAYLSKRGVDVFLAEYRGFGGCPGSPSEEGLFTDAEAALEVLRAGGVADDRLVLVGRSLGTGVAVELARQGHGRALILVSPYTSITDVAWNRFGPLVWFARLDRFDSLSRIGAVRVPVVAIHGTKDTLIPLALGKRLIEAAPSGRLVPVEGAGHNDIDVETLLATELAHLIERGTK